MPYLLDTNTISEFRRSRPNPGVMAWIRKVSTHEIYLSVLTLGEVRRGIEQLRPRDGARAAALDDWLTGISGTYAARTIGIDYEVAAMWGRVAASARGPNIDGLLAATALVRGWTIVTRNVSDFERTGVNVLNPFT